MMLVYSVRISFLTKICTHVMRRVCTTAKKKKIIKKGCFYFFLSSGIKKNTCCVYHAATAVSEIDLGAANANDTPHRSRLFTFPFHRWRARPHFLPVQRAVTPARPRFFERSFDRATAAGSSHKTRFPALRDGPFRAPLRQIYQYARDRSRLESFVVINSRYTFSVSRSDFRFSVPPRFTGRHSQRSPFVSGTNVIFCEYFTIVSLLIDYDR